MKGLGERIKLAAERIGGLDSLAEALEDVSRRTLSDWANDKTEPRATAMFQIAKATRVEPAWLFTGESDMLGLDSRGHSRRGSPSPSKLKSGSATDLDQPGMIAIPRYDEVRPSAGPGLIAGDDIPTTRVAFEQRWLVDIGVQASAAMILPAQGDSMEPTISNGSPMLVDTSKTEVRNGYIYVIAVGNDLLVKRVNRRLDGTIELISDNSAYPVEVLDQPTLEALRVIGRVFAAVSKF